MDLLNPYNPWFKCAPTGASFGTICYVAFCTNWRRRMSYVNKERFKELIKECVSKDFIKYFYNTVDGLEEDAAGKAGELFNKLDSFYSVNQEDIDGQNEVYGEDYIGDIKAGELAWYFGDIFHCASVLEHWAYEQEQHERDINKAGVMAMYMYAAEVLSNDLGGTGLAT